MSKSKGSSGVAAVLSGERRPESALDNNANLETLVGADLDTLATATVRVLFHDGNNELADIIMKISLAPGESTRDWMYPGINLVNGLFVDYDGPISGSVFMRGSE